MSGAKSAAPLYVWRKLSAAKWEDVWPDRLSEFQDRLAITALAGARTIRLEVFALTKAQAARLQKNYGGRAAVQKQPPALQPAIRAPILVRAKLAIVSSAAERDLLVKKNSARAVLIIPAGMAFGTGDHATTSTCLRFLADLAAELRGEKWEMLDLGCGSGILALAARLLGAHKAAAADFDPDAVRTTRENIRANDLTKVTVRRLDVRTWQPERTWPVITANLFSGLLVETAPKLAAATAVGSWLIFSGIMRAQQAEVLTALDAAGFRLARLVRKGKWVTGLAQRREENPQRQTPNLRGSRKTR